MKAGAADSRSYPPAAAARRAVATLAVLGFYLSMDITLTTLLIEPMKRDMALSDLQIGLLQGTAFGLAFGLGSLPMGRIIDRRPRLRLMLIGLGIWMAAMVGTALAHDVNTLVAARIALGLMAALLVPASISLIADLQAPNSRSVATSMFVVGQAAGQAFGILAGGLAYDAVARLSANRSIDLLGLAPWRVVYLLTALIGLVPLLLMIATSEPARQETRKSDGDVRSALAALWKLRGFLAPLLLAMLFIQITMQATSVWAAPVLMRDHGLTPGQFSGWLGSVMLGGGILGALAGGRLGGLGVRRGGLARILEPAFLASIAIVPLSFFALFASIPLFALTLGLNIFAGAVVATIGVVAITLFVPNELRGLALGANVLMSTVFGTATAPAAIAALSATLGGEAHLGAAIAAVSAPSAAVGAFFFFMAMRALQLRLQVH